LWFDITTGTRWNLRQRCVAGIGHTWVARFFEDIAALVSRYSNGQSAAEAGEGQTFTR
jgi:hypothetical protein